MGNNCSKRDSSDSDLGLGFRGGWSIRTQTRDASWELKRGPGKSSKKYETRLALTRRGANRRCRHGVQFRDMYYCRQKRASR